MVISIAEYLERRACARKPQPCSALDAFGTLPEAVFSTVFPSHRVGRSAAGAAVAATEVWPDPYPAHLHALYAEASLI
jgi:hypothetical protein